MGAPRSVTPHTHTREKPPDVESRMNNYELTSISSEKSGAVQFIPERVWTPNEMLAFCLEHPMTANMK